MSKTIVIVAVDQDDVETRLEYAESHDDDLGESFYTVSANDVPDGTIRITFRIIP